MRISDWSSDVCSSDLSCETGGSRSELLSDPDAIAPRRQILSVDEGSDQRGEDHGSGDDGLVKDIVQIEAGIPVVGGVIADIGRSEERRVGKECVSTCRSRGSPVN